MACICRDRGPGRSAARSHRARRAGQRQRRHHRGDPAAADFTRGFPMIHGAIVGLGRWGRNLVEAARGHDTPENRSRRRARHRRRAQDFAAEHHLDLTDDLDAVLADPAIDAVLLATPHSLHPAQVIACAAARKQVFCEKPLALHRADAARMFGACRDGRRHPRGRAQPALLAVDARVARHRRQRRARARSSMSRATTATRTRRSITAGWRLSPEESPGGGLTGAGLHVLDAFVSLLGPVRQHLRPAHSRERGSAAARHARC